MNRLAFHLAVRDNFTSPWRAFVVAGALGCAAWLPSLLALPTLFGIVVAAAVAFAATVGVQQMADHRAIVLERNGALRSLQLRVALLSLFPSALLAMVGVVATTVLFEGPSLLAIIVVTLLAPICAAPIGIALAVRSGRASDLAEGSTRARSTATSTALIGAALLAITIGTVLVALSRSWSDLAFALTVEIPFLVIAIAVIGAQCVGLAAEKLSGLGPRARIALTPLARRRRSVAPIVAVVVLVATMGISEAVVGASFGEREAHRATTLPDVTAAAGNAANQAIVTVPPVNADALRATSQRILAGTGARAVVIEMVGSGDASAAGAHGTSSSSILPGLIDTSVRRGAVVLAPESVRTRDKGSASAWVGIVRPDQLASLGWQRAADPLDAGRVVVLPGREIGVDDKADVVVSGVTHRVGAATIAARSGGALLPGALVSPHTATALTPVHAAARVVIVPAIGNPARLSAARLQTLGDQVSKAARRLPVVSSPKWTRRQHSDLTLFASLLNTTDLDQVVHLGNDQVVLWQSGPLNDLPYFAQTATQGRRALLGLIVLPGIMTLAAVFLALGATRRDDAVLRIQGAPERFRSTVAAIQAGVIAAVASVVALLLGIGVPAAAFALYNRGADLPAIPLVVPVMVWAVAAVLPLITTLLAAVIPVMRGRQDERTPTSLDFVG